MNNCPVVVIGLGNDFRSDDAAGLIIARRIKENSLDTVRVVEGISDAAALFDAWKGAEKVIIIDAAASGMHPGRIYRFDALSENIPEDFFCSYSTHDFSITDSVELATTLGELPEEIIIFGIEGERFLHGSELSQEVEKAIPAITECILSEIAKIN